MEATLMLNDESYGPRVDAEFLGYRDAPLSVGYSSADCDHIIVGQLPLEDGSAFLGGPMNRILDTGDPLKICGTIVEGIMIDVVNLGEICRVSDKGQCNESVDEVSFPTKLDVLSSSLRIQTSEHNPPLKGGHNTAINALQTRDRTDSSKAACLVVGKTSDWDRSPFFSESGIHEAGRPSGKIGSAVKNPLCALTLGGFAFSSEPLAGVQAF